jgi:hypothetical protein
MLYPNNTAVRDSIHWHMKHHFPVAPDYKVRSMVLLSGGMDSIALLANLLQHTNHEVHAHHVDIRNQENRAGAENASLAKVLPYISKHYRPFIYSSSRYEMMLGSANTVGPDSSVVMFMASRANLSMGNQSDILWTGQLRSPIYEDINAGAIFGACHTFARSKPMWIMPFLYFNKFNIYASIPPELADLTWTCRYPHYDAAGKAMKCGECHGCKGRAQVVAIAESYKGTPASTQKSSGINFYSTNEESPCLYPRYDSNRNVMRCGICVNCDVLLTRDRHAIMQRDKDKVDQQKAAQTDNKNS